MSVPVACMESLRTSTAVGAQRSQRQCKNCGEYVTKQFIRVFGANDGCVYGCMNCSTGSELRDGGATQP